MGRSREVPWTIEFTRTLVWLRVVVPMSAGNYLVRCPNVGTIDALYELVGAASELLGQCWAIVLGM
jgi:hypothetical protein